MSDMSNYYKASVIRSHSFTFKIIGRWKNQRQNPEANLFIDRIFFKNKLALQLSEKRNTFSTNLESKLIIYMKKFLSLLLQTLQKKTFPDCLKIYRLSWWFSGLDSTFPLQGAWVLSLVRELRLCMLEAQPKKSKKKYKTFDVVSRFGWWLYWYSFYYFLIAYLYFHVIIFHVSYDKIF